MKKTIIIFMCICLLFSLSFTGNALDPPLDDGVTVSGSVGRLSWKIDRNDRLLTVRCDGVMPDLFSNRPWLNYKEHIQTLIIEDGAQDIAAWAFGDLTELTGIVIASSVKTIGAFAFKDCTKLEKVKLPPNVQSQSSAFLRCNNLKKIYFYNPTCAPDTSVPINAAIYGFPNSAAQTFADKNGYIFRVIDEPYGKYGDLDADDIITAADARIALRAAVGLIQLGENERLAADVDRNDLITAADARLILRAAVGLEDLEQ